MLRESMNIYWYMQKELNNDWNGVLFLIMIVFFIFGGCKDSQGDVLQKEEIRELPASFVTYYTNFHSDSTYQMNHIIFPLKGRVSIIDSNGVNSVEKIYEEESWQLHKPFYDSASYNQTFQMLGDQIVTETIVDKMGLLEIERRWGMMDSSWYLISYNITEKQWQ